MSFNDFKLGYDNASVELKSAATSLINYNLTNPVAILQNQISKANLKKQSRIMLSKIFI